MTMRQPIAPPAGPGESPILQLVALFQMLAKNRKLLAGLGELGSGEWKVLLDDLDALCSTDKPVGLRTAYARRVAAPVIRAHRALNNNAVEALVRGREALALMRECRDDSISQAGTKWVQESYHVE